MRISVGALGTAVVLSLCGGGPAAAAAPQLTLSIDKHAHRTADGSVVFWVHVRCGPLPGVPDFREGRAGAGQDKSGAAAEGGLSPDITCDGVERRYTAGVSVITESTFRAGPARASAAVIACNTRGDEQVCVQRAVHRDVVVRGTPPG